MQFSLGQWKTTGMVTGDVDGTRVGVRGGAEVGGVKPLSRETRCGVEVVLPSTVLAAGDSRRGGGGGIFTSQETAGRAFEVVVYHPMSNGLCNLERSGKHTLPPESSSPYNVRAVGSFVCRSSGLCPSISTWHQRMRFGCTHSALSARETAWPASFQVCRPLGCHDMRELRRRVFS